MGNIAAPNLPELTAGNSIIELFEFLLEYLAIPILLPFLIWLTYEISKKSTKAFYKLIFDELGLDLCIIAFSITFTLLIRVCEADGFANNFWYVYFICMLLQAAPTIRMLYLTNKKRVKENEDEEIHLFQLKSACYALSITMVAVIFTSVIILCDIKDYSLNSWNKFFTNKPYVLSIVIVLVLYTIVVIKCYKVIYYENYFERKINKLNNEYDLPSKKINVKGFKEYKGQLWYVSDVKNKIQIFETLLSYIDAGSSFGGLYLPKEKAKISAIMINYYYAENKKESDNEVNYYKNKMIEALAEISGRFMKWWFLNKIISKKIRVYIQNEVSIRIKK